MDSKKVYCILMILFTTAQYTECGHHTNLVIIGGTGDLARKYLWNSALKLYYQNADENITFSFYAATRLPQNEGNSAVVDILENILCEPGNSLCQKLRPSFVDSLKYVQLKQPNQYKELCHNFTLDNNLHKGRTMRQIFYFSIPSSAYESVGKNVYDHCKQHESETQIVLEKPFGSDAESAQHQASIIGKYFSEEEIYRVDHYLAKSVSKQILQFRQSNAEMLDQILTPGHVDRVEIVMKETIGVKVRTMDSKKVYCILMILFTTAQYTECGHHTNLVIIGGTGDLARKYLWNSALKLYYQNADENITFSFYAATRLPQNEGNSAVVDILENILCEPGNSLCQKLRPSFVDSLKYVQLKQPNQYKELCHNFTLDNNLHKGRTMRQIFYFSIPSSAYESVGKNVYDHCKQHESETQIVLEKPFGSDAESAQHQASIIGKYFSEEEIYRVDHYLAKSVSKQILQFRQSNAEMLDQILTPGHVDRVEIVMKETIGVKGRIDFYDQTGVIKDVMQNHLTELLALVAMELPGNISNSSEIENYKVGLLQQVLPVDPDAVLLGQYGKYIEQAREELDSVEKSYLTPTFAAALLQIKNQRWRNIPFVIVSGKQLNERSSYIRILFRDREFSVSDDPKSNQTQSKYPRQIVFQIGYGPVPSAGILVSKGLFRPVWSSGLTELSMTSKDSFIHGQSPGDFHYAVPIEEEQAYHTVLRDLYKYQKETFVTTRRVLLLWNIWNKALHETKLSQPRLYTEGSSDILNFKIYNQQLKFIKNKVAIVVDDTREQQLAAIPSNFRNKTLVCAQKNDLIQQLAANIFSSANKAVSERKAFHIAFSGGTTPLPLFHYLKNNLPLFPWENTHVWQVDERCVPHDDKQSNFLSLYENLIQHVPLPYFNIHPMPISSAGKVCSIDTKGSNLYQAEIDHLIPEQKFDFILLGIGQDGHTASLFPHTDFIKNSNTLVSLTKTKPNGKFDRMSLMPSLLNNAREISVLVTGKDKHDILHKISNIESVSVSQSFPITHILPKTGNLTWYIDLDALTGI